MEDVRVIHGDCLEAMPTMPAGSVDAIVTDPPYGTQADKDGYGRRGLYGGRRFIEGDSDLAAVAGMLAEAPRLLKADSWMAMFCSPKRRYEVESLCRSAGLMPAHEVVWDKKTPGLGGGIRYQHETVLICAKGRPSGCGALFSVVSEFVSRSKRAEGHPHEKPLGLMSSLISYCSRPGELILDPFAGSGTTLVACLKTGRRGLGYELDLLHIPTANRRILAADVPMFDRPAPTLFAEAP